MKHNIALSIISAVCLVPMLFSCIGYDEDSPVRVEPNIEVWEKDGDLVAELDAVADVGENSLHFYILDGKGKSWRINSLCSYEGASNYHMWSGNYGNLGLTPNTEYQFYAELALGRNTYYSETRTFTAPSDYGSVDLGLSVKWATCNLCATKPEESGVYYQWAGLEDVTSTGIYLDWNNCPYHMGSDKNTGWTKYVLSNETSYWSGSGSPDNKTVLDPEDDVAHVKLGGKWRMPTEAEWKELIDNCTWTWTTQNGVKGYEVTSKKSGYTSKSIFLPVAGHRSVDRVYENGLSGSYWSSSRYVYTPLDAYYLDFFSGGVHIFSTCRYFGYSIRPVYGDAHIHVTKVNLSKTSLSLKIGETYTLNAMIIPSNANEQSVSWSSNNTSVVTVDQNGKVTALKAGSATITVKTTDGGYTATCSVTVKSPEPVTPDAVDLGLSVKWATCNIGATKPEEYGGYYQWAGLEDVTNTSVYLDWNNCPYHTGSDEVTGWTKYVSATEPSYWSGSGSPDNKTVLDSSDDVAHVKLGGKWRMPTDAEWTELRENCTWTWTTQNDVNGYKVTSKKSGYTNKSIFLPAAGSRGHDVLSYINSRGWYWSSSHSMGLQNYSSEVSFNSSGISNGSGFRYYGNPVRPVYGERVAVAGVDLYNGTNISMKEGEICTFVATIIPSNATERSVGWSSNNTGVATVDQNGKVTAVKPGSATITVKTTDGGYIATCSVTVRPSDPTTTSGAIDLGLSVKWATCNIGATKPEEFGGLYQWAGLEDVANTSIYLDYNNCPYHTGSNPETGWTKYVPSDKSSYWSGSGGPDNKTVLDPSDDVAHVKLGGKWRMPTDAEWTELRENCTWTWTTQNGVKGYKVTSKKSGYTSKSIFLPAADCRIKDYPSSAGLYGGYWSSSLDTGYPSYAYLVHFNPGGVDRGSDARYGGRSVRPVTE